MILMSVLFLCAGQASADTAVREEQLMLPIKVGSHVEKIDALIVRPAHAGKFPIALIVNGSAGASPSSVRADWLSHIAHDFAHRGWLALQWCGRAMGVLRGDLSKAGEIAPILQSTGFSMPMARSLALH
jgi:hypothetical protein